LIRLLCLEDHSIDSGLCMPLGEEAGSASASGDTDCFGFQKQKRQGAPISTEKMNVED
jgi:hypothetical protein